MAGTSQRATKEQDLGAPPDGLNQDDWDKMVSDATFFFLVADQKKGLIKRADMMSSCNLRSLKRGDSERALEAARERLAKVFGIKLVESQSKAGCFYMVNLLKEDGSDESLQHVTWSEKESAQMGLTFTILGLIFMGNGKISDTNLFKFMKQLGVGQEERGNARGNQGEIVPEEIKEIFDGDAKKFVNDVLVGRQHYLYRTRVAGPDAEVESYEYSWGERAELEVKKSDVLKMVVELYDCEPRMFKEQFDKVKDLEGEGAMEEAEEQ